MSSRIVLIGAVGALPSLQERLDQSAEIQTFNDGEALEALDHIMRTKPTLVAMQDGFTATSRGMAFINRIKDDPTLHCEVRVMASDTEQNRVAVKRGSRTTDTTASLDLRGTRRAPRVPIKEGVDVAVDGNPASLVNLSTVGAQVVSPTVLKPNQRVRVVMGDGKAAVKCSGAIAWAAFEMPKGVPTRYRAGIDWGITADGSKVEGFALKHKKDKDKEKE